MAINNIDLDLKSHRPHQFEGVASLHHAGAQKVVEGHLPVFEMILKVDVRRARGQTFSDARQCQIMCRD